MIVKPSATRILLDALELDAAERREIVAEARRRARRTVVAWLQIAMAAILIWAPAAGTVVAAGDTMLIALGDPPGWIRGATAIALLVGTAVAGCWLVPRLPFGDVGRRVRDLLRERGHRYCGHCLYNLHGREDVEACPECGAYVSRRPGAAAGLPPIVRDRSGRWSCQAFVRDGELPPERIEALLIELGLGAPSGRRRFWSWFRDVAVTLSLIVPGAMLLAFAGRLGVGAQVALFAALAAGAGALLAFAIVMAWRMENRATRFRRRLRGEGVVVCDRCRRFLGSAANSPSVCPACTAPLA